MNGSIPASEMMRRRLVTVAPEDDVAKGIELMLRHKVSGLPVVTPDRQYQGMFSQKCCFRLMRRADNVYTSMTAKLPRVAEFMESELLVLHPEMDVFSAIRLLLDHRYSGAPVVSDAGQFLGVFSEKTCLHLVIDAAFYQQPTATVSAFMNTETERILDPDDDLLTVIRRFVETPYRRLPVLDRGRLVGQVSRCDVLRSRDGVVTLLASSKDRQLLRLSRTLKSPTKPSHLSDATGQFVMSRVMDAAAPTVDEATDHLQIAMIFLNTPYRRLPVLRDGTLVGQVSRRDLLSSVFETLVPQPAPLREPSIRSLYLSALFDRKDRPQALS